MNPWSTTFFTIFIFFWEILKQTPKQNYFTQIMRTIKNTFAIAENNETNFMFHIYLILKIKVILFYFVWNERAE